MKRVPYASASRPRQSTNDEGEPCPGGGSSARACLTSAGRLPCRTSPRPDGTECRRRLVAFSLRDQLALGMAGVEQLARIVVPHRLGDLVDQVVRLLALVTHWAPTARVCDVADALVGSGRDRVLGEELYSPAQLVDLRRRRAARVSMPPPRSRARRWRRSDSRRRRRRRRARRRAVLSPAWFGFRYSALMSFSLRPNAARTMRASTSVPEPGSSSETRLPLRSATDLMLAPLRATRWMVSG